jgi:hypothetical protein
MASHCWQPATRAGIAGHRVCTLQRRGGSHGTAAGARRESVVAASQIARDVRVPEGSRWPWRRTPCAGAMSDSRLFSSTTRLGPGRSRCSAFDIVRSRCASRTNSRSSPRPPSRGDADLARIRAASLAVAQPGWGHSHRLHDRGSDRRMPWLRQRLDCLQHTFNQGLCDCAGTTCLSGLSVTQDPEEHLRRQFAAHFLRRAAPRSSPPAT